MILAYLGAAFIAGIALAAGLNPPLPVCIVLSIAFVTGAVGFWPKGMLRLVFLILLAVSLGAVRFSMSPPEIVPALPVDERVTVTAVVDRAPVHTEKSLELLLKTESVSTAGNEQAAETSIIAWVAPYQDLRWGDRLRLTGQLQRPDHNLERDFALYVENRGAGYVMTLPAVQVLPGGNSNHPLRWLNNLQIELASKIDASMSAPESALLKGILLGNRSSMPRNLLDGFAATGTTHIIAISGFNITLVAGLLGLAAGLLRRRRLAMAITLGGIALYTVFVGANPAVVRAALMGSLWFIARQVGRERDATTAVVLTACLMAVFDPLVIWDIGFQLSFASVAGLIYLSPYISKWLRRVPALVRESLVATIAAQVAVFPILLHDFEQASLIAIPANLLVVPVVVFVMGAGALTVAAALIWAPLGTVVAWPAWLGLAYILKVVELSASVPFAAVATPAFPVWAAWLWYLALALLLIRPKIDWGRIQPAGAVVRRAAESQFTLVFLLTTCLVIWVMVGFSYWGN